MWCWGQGQCLNLGKISVLSTSFFKVITWRRNLGSLALSLYHVAGGGSDILCGSSCGGGGGVDGGISVLIQSI